jgi:putative two-component system response regulator
LIDTSYSDAGILVIDADADAVRYLVRTLQEAGYGCVQACTDPALLPNCTKDGALDLIMVNVGDRELEGLSLLQELRSRLPADDFLPVVAVGSATGPAAAVMAMQAGAKDYLETPLDLEEMVARLDSLLETRDFGRRMREAKQVLEELLRRRTRESHESHMDLLDRLALVAELRDDPSGGHPTRVGRLSGLIAQELMLSAEETRRIMRAAPLHDLGNVGIPDEVVRLEGNFTDEQREQMREHTKLGAYLLHGAESDVLQTAEQIALNHHERWDGLGYPSGLSGTDIPISARIVAVADTFDAMTHPRLYKEPCSVATALDEIRRESGWQFDPEVVAALIEVYERQPGMLTITPRARPRTVC